MIELLKIQMDKCDNTNNVSGVTHRGQDFVYAFYFLYCWC